MDRRRPVGGRLAETTAGVARVAGERQQAEREQQTPGEAQRSIEVVIQGNRYVLKSDDPEKHVLRVAEMVDDALRQVSGGKGPPSYHVAVLTALNFASELVKARGEHETLRKEIDAKTETLISLIDDKLTSSGRS